MTAIVYLAIYAAVLAFFVACAVRAVRYAKVSAHLRWELYPVPHEEAERTRHGGSYFEISDWWTKPDQFNLAGELKVMVPEMLFLKALREVNRRLWYRSFLFHFGLYLVAATLALLVLAALGTLMIPSYMAHSLGRALHILYTITGAGGVVMGTAGAAGLLVRRLRDADLKNYTVPGDIFNLSFFIVVFGLLAVGYLLRGPGAPGILDITTGILTLRTATEVPPVLASGLLLGALLAAYIPLTHMSHFIAKYFLYHSIRWDDLPTARSAELQRRFAQYLTYRPTWAAGHIGADGSRSWVDIATLNPTVGGGK